jgi:DNA polymerase III alpha subunit (gram-positive type)
MIAIVFDTETTGLIINPARALNMQPEIISLAAQEVNLATGEKLMSYYNEFKPIKPVSEEITKITGFTNDHLSKRPSIAPHLDEIITFLESGKLLIGQNLSFDQKMLELECKRYNRTIKWPKGLDLVENSIFIKGYRLSLTNLHLELFGKAYEDAHQADVDVDATCRCACEMFKRGWL